MKIKKGLTLIELLIFILILNILLVGAASFSTYLIRVTKFNQYKILATHHAEEALEWIKAEKDKDWQNFTNLVYDDNSETTYCIVSLDWTSIGSCDRSYFLGTPNIFIREVKLINEGVDPVLQTNIRVIVSWKDGSNDYNVTLKSNLKILE
jgi:type II secretory pathway pseudopilin PulG